MRRPTTPNWDSEIFRHVPPADAVPLFDAIFEELDAARTKKREAQTLGDALKWDRTAKALEALRSRLRARTFDLQDRGLC